MESEQRDLTYRRRRSRRQSHLVIFSGIDEVKFTEFIDEVDVLSCLEDVNEEGEREQEEDVVLENPLQKWFRIF